MTKKYLLLAGLFTISAFIVSCDREDPVDMTDSENVWEVSVGLDASKPVIRGQEALLGNLFGDAWMAFVKDSLRENPDFAIPNGGNIRFNEGTRPSGIYPAGNYTEEHILEMCFYENSLMMITVTGTQLKAILERSVSSLPTDYKGWFLQCSKELNYTADLSKQAQALNTDQNVITIPGERITSIKINGAEYSPTSSYKLLVLDYLGAEGKDGYVTFSEIDGSLKKDLGNYREALRYYLTKYSPVTPVLDGRITFVE